MFGQNSTELDGHTSHNLERLKIKELQCLDIWTDQSASVSRTGNITSFSATGRL